MQIVKEMNKKETCLRCKYWYEQRNFISYKKNTSGEELEQSRYVDELGLYVTNQKSASQSRFTTVL